MLQNNKIQSNFLANPKGKKYTFNFIVGSAACENDTVDKGIFFNFQRKAKTEHVFHEGFHATCEFKPSKWMDFEQIIKDILSLRTFFA